MFGVVVVSTVDGVAVEDVTRKFVVVPVTVDVVVSASKVVVSNVGDVVVGRWVVVGATVVVRVVAAAVVVVIVVVAATVVVAVLVVVVATGSQQFFGEFTAG